MARLNNISAAEAPKRRKPPPAFSQIQEKSLTSQAGFKHVEKNAHKKDPASAPAQVPQPKKPAGTPAPAKEEVKRPPSKTHKMNTWYVENYGKEVLKFEGDEEVQPSYGWALIKCTDTTVVIDGKIKTVMLENCTGVKLIVNNVLSNIEIINCKKITITVKDLVPTMNVERSLGVQIYLFPTAKSVKVYTTCSQSIVLHYPKTDATDDDEWLDIAIPETNITQIKNDSLHTEAMEGME